MQKTPEISIYTTREGPVRISKNVELKIIEIAAQAARIQLTHLQTCKKVIGNFYDVSSNFWETFSTNSTTEIRFVDSRLGPEISYPLAQKMRGNHTPDPYATADLVMIDCTLSSKIEIYTTPTYGRRRSTPKMDMNWFYLLHMPGIFLHELVHNVESIFYQNYQKSSFYTEKVDPQWLRPIVLAEGLANILSIPDYFLSEVRHNQYKAIFKPALYAMVNYAQLAEHFAPFQKLKYRSNFLDIYAIESPYMDGIDTDQIAFSDCENFCTYLALIGMRLGFSPTQLLEMLIQANEVTISTETDTRPEPKDLLPLLNQHQVSYSSIFQEEGIKIMFETLLFYLNQYDQSILLQGKLIDCYDENQRIGNKAIEGIREEIQTFNLSLYTSLVGNVSIFRTYVQEFLSLIRKNSFIRVLGETNTEQTSNSFTNPISIFSGSLENPYLPMIQAAGLMPTHFN